MASYEILWKRSAEQDLRKIDRQQLSRIVVAIGALAEDPFPPGSRKLRGSEGAHRLRVGDYRVIYQVDVETRTLVVVHVRHRREAYRE